MHTAEHCESESQNSISHREIASTLGLSRSRVFFIEKRAVVKLRQILGNVGITSLETLFDATREQISATRASYSVNGKSKLSNEYESPLDGWTAVNRTVSINSGSVKAIDVSRAYRFLKARNEREVRPPVLITTEGDVKRTYSVQGVNALDDTLLIKVPQLDGSIQPNGSSIKVTAIVESIFDTDERGAFDVPLLLGVIARVPFTAERIRAKSDCNV